MNWLNGWPLLIGDGKTPATAVLIGTAVHCIGCGKFHGITCVAFSDGYVSPEKLPDWPFIPKDCPVCYLSEIERNKPPQPKGSWAEFEKRIA